jgi:hypothetical protein
VLVTDKFSAIADIQDLTARIDPWMFAIAGIVSLVASLLAGWLYCRFYERRGTGSQIHRAFPLLGLSITALFICIQVSLPLSLGLLGALSIIRFRTPIKEPEEVGFIMLVISSSIVCATFNFHYLAILFVLATVTLYAISLVRGRSKEHGDGIILVVMKDSAAAETQRKVEECVSRRTRRSAVESASSKSGETSLQFSFSGFAGQLAEFQAELNQLGNISSVNVFFNRPGSIS